MLSRWFETERPGAPKTSPAVLLSAFILLSVSLASPLLADDFELGKEVAVQERLADGDETNVDRGRLIAHGAELFNAMWTVQEGGGRP